MLEAPLLQSRNTVGAIKQDKLIMTVGLGYDRRVFQMPFDTETLSKRRIAVWLRLLVEY